MKLPALWIVAGFAGGIALEGARNTRPLLWLIPAAIFIAFGLVLLLVRNLKAAWLCALLAWFALGGLAASIEKLSTASDNVAKLASEGRIDISVPLRWEGKLREDPTQFPWGLRYVIDLNQVEVAGRTISATGGLRLGYFYNRRAPEIPSVVRAGDRVEVLAKARVPQNFLDPGAFDERGFLARQRIYLTGTLRSAELLHKLDAGSLTLAERLARIRGDLLNRIGSLFRSSPMDVAILRAMLLGDRSFVDSDLAATFQKTAAYHVLVVAGLHVAALALFVFWLGRWLHFSMGLTTVATLVALAAYVGIVQDRPPILRAALMAAVFLIARFWYRRVELLNTVALAALALLVARPSELGDASFQLSFLAAVVIAGVALPWIERSSSSYRAALEHLSDVSRDGAYEPKMVQLRLDLRAVTRWLAAKLPARFASRAASFLTLPLRAGLRLWEIALLSFCIQLGLVPLLATYFHRVTLTGPACNIPAVLLTSLIVPFGFLTLLASYIWTPLAAALGKITVVLASWLLASVKWFGQWPRASWRIAVPPAWVVIAFLAALGCFIMAARSDRHRMRNRSSKARRNFKHGFIEWASGIAILILAAVMAADPFAPRLEKGELEVTVLDVGQGDSIFIAFPEGHTMLVDGGGLEGAERVGGYRTGLDIGEEVVSPYLWQRGLKKLDVVALTHAHQDHIGGLHAVLDNFRVSELWVGRDENTASYRSLLAEAEARGVRVIHHEQGETFTEDSVVGRVLWPADLAAVEKASNNDSLVIRLRDGSVRFLLSGDIEQEVEQKLVSEKEPLSADFLKAPHHGSHTSSTEAFLDAVSPHVAVISVGRANSFGLPSPEVVGRYETRGIRLLRTDHDGAVTALTDGRSLEVSSFAREAPK